MKRALVFFAVTLLLLACSRAKPMTYAVHGIDVSHHQGVIDWEAVAKTDIAFVYMKATEGGDWQDPQFSINWSESRRMGIPAGAYHFFSTCRSGATQARNFLVQLRSSDMSLPSALDLEYGGFCGAPPSRDILMREVKAWIDIVQNHTGQPVVIYTTKDFHDAFLSGEFLDQPFWLRSIGHPPRYDDRSWVIWQHSNRGAVKGINGPVDLNVFNGDFETFRSFSK